MKRNWKIAIALALALCFVAALMACNDDDYVYVYETDEAGETVTDTEGNPIIETDENGEKVTTPDTNKDGIADKDQTDENGNVTTKPEGTTGSGVHVADANTEGGWGEIITPN